MKTGDFSGRYVLITALASAAIAVLSPRANEFLSQPTTNLSVMIMIVAVVVPLLICNHRRQ